MRRSRPPAAAPIRTHALGLPPPRRLKPSLSGPFPTNRAHSPFQLYTNRSLLSQYHRHAGAARRRCHREIATRASDGLCRPDDRMTRRSRACSDLSDTSYRRAHKPITSVSNSIITYIFLYAFTRLHLQASRPWSMVPTPVSEIRHRLWDH